MVTLVVGILIAGVVVTPSAAFTTSSIDRQTTATVADDASGFLGIAVTDNVRAGSEDQLVTVTNNLSQSVTITVSSSAVLSNDQATLAPGESFSTAATVSCESPPNELQMTISASASDRFSGIATRSASVDTTGCSDSSVGYKNIEITDQTTSSKGAKAEYDLTYAVENTTGSFDRVTVEFNNLDRSDGNETRESFAQNDTISFTSGGQREGESFEITVRLFDGTGEVKSERIVVTDTADGSGTVYKRP
jgi:hypothetical protein